MIFLHPEAQLSIHEYSNLLGTFMIFQGKCWFSQKFSWFLVSDTNTKTVIRPKNTLIYKNISLLS